MPDLVFPPSILRRYKEFIIESALTTQIPSLGAIPSGGSDRTLLGTVVIGEIDATTLDVITHYVSGQFQAGGKSGDGITGSLKGIVRDTTANPTAAKSAVGDGTIQTPPNVDLLQTGTIASGAASTFKDTITGSLFPAVTRTDSFAYDLYFVRSNSAGSPVDPGLWTLFSFSATYAILVFGPIPKPPT